MSNSLIKKYEGFSSVCYVCPAGVKTIGYGSTCYADGSPIKKGDCISKEKAEALLNDYLIKNVYPILDKFPYKLTEDQRDALASLIYNIGAPAFNKSKLYKALKAKNWAEVFRQWDFGITQAKGLIKRRSEELYLFVKDI